MHGGTPTDLESRERLAEALPEDAVSTDDHILFLEHPELPEHWRAKSDSTQG